MQEGRDTILLSQITLPFENHGYGINVSALDVHIMNSVFMQKCLHICTFASAEEDGLGLLKWVGNKKWTLSKPYTASFIKHR